MLVVGVSESVVLVERDARALVVTADAPANERATPPAEAPAPSELGRGRVECANLRIGGPGHALAISWR